MIHHKIYLSCLGAIAFCISVAVLAKAPPLAGQEVSCEFKSEFDDTIPADVSYIKFGAQPFKVFKTNPDFFSSHVEDCQLHRGRYYVLSVSQSQPARTLTQSLIEVTQFDLNGKKVDQKFYNKGWTCALTKGFVKKNQSLFVDTQCTDKSNFDEYGEMIHPEHNKSYHLEVK
ncbi:hypothetical protein [Acinetobacter nematophilus]|uniref:Uncharacterized protein n=1 Tax=Acinetobacter nematophilus TaxID=2994642 RepID=A0A9X3DVV9_9GAMM|nr:hypothetical protein [Acinetobacter nematophilus]MCX5468777.1 hypothetical protein [Acinetobacter nematophilus]